MNVVKKGFVDSKKRKSKTAESSVAVHNSPSKTLDPPMSVLEETHQESSDFGEIFKRKKLKLTPIQSHMRTTNHTAVS